MTSEQDLVGEIDTGYDKPNGHRVIRNRDGEWFLIVPKHAPFRMFGKIFLKNDTIVGDSLNRDSLLDAVNKKATLLFVYARHIYEIKAVDFYEWAYEHHTYRRQSSGEGTYSVPLSIMTKHERTFRERVFSSA